MSILDERFEAVSRLARTQSVQKEPHILSGGGVHFPWSKILFLSEGRGSVLQDLDLMESPETLGEKLVMQRSRQAFEEEAVVYSATADAVMEYSVTLLKRSQWG